MRKQRSGTTRAVTQLASASPSQHGQPGHDGHDGHDDSNDETAVIEVMTRQRETVMTVIRSTLSLGPIRAPLLGFGPVPILTPHITTGNMASADLGPLKPADLPMLYTPAEVANQATGKKNSESDFFEIFFFLHG